MNIFNRELKMSKDKIMGLTGMTDEFFCMFISNLFTKDKKNILIVTSTLYEANNILSSISSYTKEAYLFPMDEFLTSQAIATSPDLLITRLETLNRICTKDPLIVVTHTNGYLKYLPTRKKYEESFIKLAKETEITREDLIKKLLSIGYIRETTVTKTGEVGIRGFVIDIFPIGEDHPIRIEFFGDEIEAIRIFDEESQSSIKEINNITIRPNTEFLTDKKVEIISNNKPHLEEYSNKVASISDYFEDFITVYKDYNQIKQNYISLAEEMFNYREKHEPNYTGNYILSLEKAKTDEIIYYNTVDNLINNLPSEFIYDFGIKEVGSFHEDIDAINKFLKTNIEKNKTIIIYLKDYQITKFTNSLEIEYVLTEDKKITPNKVNIINKSINKGFCYQNYIVLTDKELFNTKVNKHRYKTNFKYSSKIRDIKHLKIGDYIVHNIHGIGIYNGIKTLTKQGLNKDYLEILYQGKDKLYIAVEKIEMISKYNGREGLQPKINKLGSAEWEKTKLRVKTKVKSIAQELIKLYAAREAKKGHSFKIDDELQTIFESEFVYTPTKDQETAVKQIKKDMESQLPMDRLLCGDVGYGKTEVAFRAIFKAINDGKQVLYLCPTTILSNQQYISATERFKNFPIEIGVLNRFTTPKDTKNIVERLKNGKIDLVFGTHRLLSDDIRPKDLGLLVIDEEQRFGVTHKEKIKKYKEDVDVLTLTATPIPRTLQMSLAGIRSLSLIETPPVNRYPIQTYVIEENDYIIRDAIYKEISRNGQVFILYNSVEKIESKLNEIQRLVPEAKIVYAHGQLTKSELESRMIDFINHEFDILLCTTIIETGIDIPNVNTLIILDADHFGLSQLYQIRGRVGRSDKIAYTYLMYKPNKVLTETAIKRLNVIKEFTELGSGFAIATRDLSIRGAGDLLGSEQAGFIDNIGIDLYMKILDEEVRRLKGEDIEEEKEEEKPLIDVETHIDDKYVDDDDLKIEIHNKINTIDSKEKLERVRIELEDRFGKLNESTIVYMYAQWFEALAKKLNIENVKETKNYIELVFSKEETMRIDCEKLFLSAYKVSNMFRFMNKKDHLIIVLDTIKLEKHHIYYIVDLLTKVEYKN